MIISKTAFARAGLIGNPSDGYYGKTVATLVKNFHAEVTLFASPELTIEPNLRDHSTFNSMRELAEDIRFSGYYGGIRLLKAAIKKFHEYVVAHEIECPNHNFTIRYDSNIPLRVGLAGSSAIITATMRALSEFYEVEIPKAFLPTLVLRVETEELGIQAGLQDRVIQTYGGCVYMDFEQNHLEEFQFGRYDYLDITKMPPLYVAYLDVLSEGTEVVHNDLHARWESGDKELRSIMLEFANLTEQFAKAYLADDFDAMAMLMNANFDLRTRIQDINDANWKLINAARNVEASAKFCGSGGAIVGIYRDDNMYCELEQAMKNINAKIVKVLV